MSGADTDIEELHQLALRKGSTTYIDPTTGFTCFTELSHLLRGTCCGNRCRHCPYGWSNVQTGEHRKGKLQSGDMETAKRLAQEIMSNAQQDELATNIETSVVEQQPQRTSGKGGRHGGQFTTKNVPYTRKGDQGTSQLLTGERRSKADSAFEAMGTVDELCAVVGVAHAEITLVDDDTSSSIYGELPEWLLDVMSRLFDLGSHVAKPKRDGSSCFDADGVGGGFHQSHVDQLEDWIDIMTDELPELNCFILPTGGKASAPLPVARTVCRRAERRVVELVNYQVCDPNAMRYLNRLSDFFFTAARWVNYREGKEEIQYRREYRGAKQRSRQTVSLNSTTTEDKSI